MQQHDGCCNVTKMLVNQVMNLSRWNIGSEHYRVKILFKDLC